MHENKESVRAFRDMADRTEIRNELRSSLNDLYASLDEMKDTVRDLEDAANRLIDMSRPRSDSFNSIA